MDDGNFFKITHFARTVAIVMIATIGTTTADVAAQQIRWRNSTDVRRKLAQPNQSSYTWQGISLRSALRDLSQSEGVRIAMLLDRRVDPGKKTESDVLQISRWKMCCCKSPTRTTWACVRSGRSSILAPNGPPIVCAQSSRRRKTRF